MRYFAKVATVAILATSLLALVGCSPKTTPPAPAATPSPTPAAEKSVEIFSWWTGGGEEAGLNGLIDLFKKKNPDIKVINAAVAGGAGTNAKAVLATRMSGGNPPDTFQVHAGHELLDTWVLAGKMDNLNDLYKGEGWDAKFPKQLIDMMSKDSKIYSVAVNIHRSNVMWYNKKVLDDNGIQAPKSWDDFFKAAETLKAKNIPALALGDKEPWTDVHLFESVLLSVTGPDGYKDLFNGKKHWDDPQVKTALETYKRVLGYANQDHQARTWQGAIDLVSDGKAAMSIMGDWAKGYLVGDLKKQLGKDWGWVPSPGTSGTFLMLSDSFGLPLGVKHKAEVLAFLKVLGSQEGQDIFNPLKGSIPARTDADKSKYDDYGKAAMADWSSNQLAPSIAHGAAASPGFSDKLTNAVSVFVTAGDVDQALKALKAAESELK